VKPSGTGAERSAEPVSPATEPHPARADDLWEVFLSADNLARALRRVEVNRGAPGPDGMSTAELRPYLKAAWPDSAQNSTLAHTDPAPSDG
jgi:RNA-directed DNA polymerase